MTKLFHLRAFRVLTLGGAKANTNDDLSGVEIEQDEFRYN